MDDAHYESIASRLDADESDAIAVKEWPVLPLEALHGLAGDAVHLATTDCEADPAAVLITFLAWFGAACGQPDGKTPYLRIGETRHAPRLFAAVVGAIGNVAGSTIAGVDTVWVIPLSMAPQLVLGNLVGMAVGFTLGVVLRNSAAGIVAYFVVSLVMPGILVLLAQVRPWFEDLQPWIDWNTAQEALFVGATDTGREWAMLASTTMIWIVIPLVVGLLFLRRSEVK